MFKTAVQSSYYLESNSFLTTKIFLVVRPAGFFQDGSTPQFQSHKKQAAAHHAPTSIVQLFAN